MEFGWVKGDQIGKAGNKCEKTAIAKEYYSFSVMESSFLATVQFITVPATGL